VGESEALDDEDGARERVEVDQLLGTGPTRCATPSSKWHRDEFVPLFCTIEGMTDRFGFEVKEKGRVVFPVGLRAACHFEVGTRLIGRPVGPGQALVETTDAVFDRLWSGAPTGDTDAVEELWKWRAAQAAELRREGAPSTDEANPVGDALLRSLGLA
jgi:hypothetical protein